MSVRYKQRARSASFWNEKTEAIEFDGIPINVRECKDQLKVNHRLHHAHDRRIVQTFIGYLSNPVAISLDEEKYSEDSDTISDMIEGIKYFSKDKEQSKKLLSFLNVKQSVKHDILEYLKIIIKYILCKTSERQNCQYILDKIIIYEKYKNDVF